MPSTRARRTPLDGDEVGGSSAGAPDETALPHGIELAWGLQLRPTKGPKPGLTLERIVAAGIKVARTDGLGSVSMARVAAELGAATMSLYRYVAAKDELLLLMVDRALGAPPAVETVEGDWRGGLERWARGIRHAYQSNPWALRVPISGPPLGPNNVAWLDNALSCLAGTSLTEQEKLSTVLLLSGFVRNDATLSADFAAVSSGEPQMPSYGRILKHLTTPAQFPALHAAIESGAFDDDDDPDLEFDFGLLRIFDGVATLMGTHG